MKILDVLNEANGALDSTRESRAKKQEKGPSLADLAGPKRGRKAGDLSKTGASEGKSGKLAAAAKKAEAARTEAARSKQPAAAFIRNYIKNHEDTNNVEKRNAGVTAKVSDGSSAGGINSTPQSRKDAKHDNDDVRRAANTEHKAKLAKKEAEKKAKEAGEDASDEKKEKDAAKGDGTSLRNVGKKKFRSNK